VLKSTYESFRIDFLIYQLEDINPKGLTLIKTGFRGYASEGIVFYAHVGGGVGVVGGG
jgi:hypothetical protein